MLGSLENLIKDKQTIAVICDQWGDTGKGKFSDYFADRWADVIARGTGGNNAGHTVVVNGKERIFHLVPTGIVYDNRGKINILGNGMVLDLKVLSEELDGLDKDGISYNNLMISEDAHVIMPYHIEGDRARNKSQKEGGIGSTGRGIGPCYADKIARRGIRVADLFDKDGLVKKINEAISFYPEQDINIEKIIYEVEPFFNGIKPFVKDTTKEMHRFLREGKKILLEGAQGLLLSIEHGTYPYVTSSDCSLNGTASGVGLSAKAIDLSLGLIKFPFMTRVGGGPFPTELSGIDSERYCSSDEHTREYELKEYGIPYTTENGKIRYNHKHKKIIDMINSDDSFTQGIGIRLAAGEYGATTGRPRRIGWTDAVAAKYAVAINGPKIVLTKVDALAGAKGFRICYEYTSSLNNRSFSYREFNRDCGFLRRVLPVYAGSSLYEGYSDISGEKDYYKLPPSLRKAIGDFESFTGGEVVIVSVGADREKTIVK